MFEIVAVICMLAWPDDVMTSELVCERYTDTLTPKYAVLSECETRAYQRLEETVQAFDESDADWETITVQCDRMAVMPDSQQ